MNQPDYSPDYSIVARTPSVEDYLCLRAVAGLSPFSREAAEKGLRGTVFSVLVLHAGSAIGMGRLIGDVPANRLYEKFGFKETAPRSLGMAYRVSTSA